MYTTVNGLHKRKSRELEGMNYRYSCICSNELSKIFWMKKICLSNLLLSQVDSSDRSPQSSVPSHTHFVGTHRVLLHRKKSAWHVGFGQFFSSDLSKQSYSPSQCHLFGRHCLSLPHWNSISVSQVTDGHSSSSELSPQSSILSHLYDSGIHFSDLHRNFPTPHWKPRYGGLSKRAKLKKTFQPQTLPKNL